jgi:16S rRNA (guanine(966)-N(2))-methyltransferase RsmD
MRIITGKYKGRRFDVPRSFKARPTTDFAKENLFNVLGGYLDFDGTDALDLFCGTGSITLELLSRGCRSVTAVEMDRDHCAFIRSCLSKLGDDNAYLLRTDVFRYLRQCRQQFDFIFADPPYQLPNLSTLPEQVLTRSILKPGGLFVLEHGQQYDFKDHPLFEDHRCYGSVNFSIFRCSEQRSEQSDDRLPETGEE